MKSIKIGLLLVCGLLAVGTFGCSGGGTPPATGTPAVTGSPAAPATP